MLRLFSVRQLAALSICVATAASAQTMVAPAVTPVAAPAVAPAPMAPPSQTAPPAAYRSAFEGYQAYSDEKIAPWKESNDTVGKVGGWRAYAKEAQEPQAPGARQPAAAGAAVGAGAANPHAGHGKP